MEEYLVNFDQLSDATRLHFDYTHDTGLCRGSCGFPVIHLQGNTRTHSEHER
jgi:hypothetical protein